MDMVAAYNSDNKLQSSPLDHGSHIYNIYANIFLTFLIQSSTFRFSNILGLEKDREMGFVIIILLKAWRNSANKEGITAFSEDGWTEKNLSLVEE